MVAQDNDGFAPPHNDDEPPYPPCDWRYGSFIWRLRPYARNDAPTKCPDHQQWGPPGTPDPDVRWWSYDFNRGCEYGPQQPGWLSAFEDPGNTVVMLDGAEEDEQVELTDEDSLDKPGRWSPTAHQA